MFRTRLLSGIVLVLIAVLTLNAGGIVLFSLLLVLSLIGMMELYRTLDIHKTGLSFVGYAAAILYYFMVWKNDFSYFQALIMGMIILLMSIYVFTFPKYKANEIMCAFFGVFYVACMLSYIYLTRSMDGGKYLVWLVFIASWGCDTCAYCAGCTFGKRKMAPILSPKKSVEGAIGGLIGAALIGVIYAVCIKKFAETSFIPWHFAVVSLFCGCMSIVGDLCASAIKRNHEIKDYGKLIPGHGGVLDRFDSVIFTAPLIYYLLKLLVI